METARTHVRLDELGRILVIRLGALGDVVRTIPGVQALRAAAPQAKIAWLVDDRCAAILEGLPYVDECLVLPRRELRAASRNPLAWGRWLHLWRSFRRRIRAWRADAVFDFHGLFKTGVLTRCARAPLRIGYVRGHSKEGSWRAYNVLVDPGPVRIPRLERNLALVEKFGAKRPAGPPELTFTQAHRARVEDILARLDASRVVALVPGSSRARKHKRWPPGHFAALADLLAAKAGLIPLVVSGPGEQELAARIRAAARCDVRLAPPVSLKELALLLGRSCCAVGADTGPMHIASIMRTPVVTILGPTDPVQNRPLPYSPSRLLEPDADVPHAQRRAADVPPERVFEAVTELLRQANDAKGRKQPGT